MKHFQNRICFDKNEHYRYVAEDLYKNGVFDDNEREIANNIKYLDKCYINRKKNNINKSFLNYIEPLIYGKTKNQSTNGLYDFSKKLHD